MNEPCRSCPPWVECVHFEGRVVIFSDFAKLPPEHALHVSAEQRFQVTLWPVDEDRAYVDCDVGGVVRGLATGSCDMRPFQLYFGEDEAAAREAKAHGEDALRSGLTPDGKRAMLRGRA